MQTTGVEGYIPYPEACALCQIPRITIDYFYKWYNNPNYEKPEGLTLPKIYKIGCVKKAFKPEDVSLLKKLYFKYKKYDSWVRFHSMCYKKYREYYCTTRGLDLNTELLLFHQNIRKEDLKNEKYSCENKSQ